MEIFFETERLLFRRFTEDDAENLFELDNDPEVMRFITGGRPTPRDEIQKRGPARVPRPVRAVGGVRLLGCDREIDREVRRLVSSAPG